MRSRKSPEPEIPLFCFQTPRTPGPVRPVPQGAGASGFSFEDTARPGPNPGGTPSRPAPRSERDSGLPRAIGPFRVARLVFTPSRSDRIVDPPPSSRASASTGSAGVLLPAVAFPLVIGAFIAVARPPS
ncbi:hypothetical protein GCM10010405_38590 [Streptomyces macrosporus]|uniref:Uncharacterized protein n=1 Tax=Streptomyces macrosporus TaxID=44032 RepID=A0ABN3K871_9ACTN